MRRWLALLVLTLAVAPGTWWRTEWRPPEKEAPLHVTPQALPDRDALADLLGPFELKQAWRLDSRHRWFGGYSALLATSKNELLAFSDGGRLMRLPLPNPAGGGVRLDKVFPPQFRGKTERDIESATRDPVSGTIWLGIENANAIFRFRLDSGVMAFDGSIVPPHMAMWVGNEGPEALTRLDDGRFVVLRERFDGSFEDRRHEALLFAEDPLENGEVEKFALIGPKGFSPTDLVQLPDGQLLVLFRKLVPSFPPGFATILAVGDPHGIKAAKSWRVREVAHIPSGLGGDNFEGITVLPGEKGNLLVWLISDSNHSAFQQTLLWQLSVDLEDLKPETKKARGPAARPSKSEKSD